MSTPPSNPTPQPAPPVRLKLKYAIGLIAAGGWIAWPYIASVICGATNGSFCLSEAGHAGGALGTHREMGSLARTIIGGVLIVAGLKTVDSIK